MEQIERLQLAKELASFFLGRIEHQLTVIVHDKELASLWKVKRDTFKCEEAFREEFDKLCKPWTYAVHRTLRDFASTKANWKILPPNKPFEREYLCDFTIFEEERACRIACESQWSHGSPRDEIRWAFDKLRGVKADVKLFIYEGLAEHFDSAVKDYLGQSEQVGPYEIYVALRWTPNRSFDASFWQPQVHGRQQPDFKSLSLD